jgi:hypothetical protein
MTQDTASEVDVLPRAPRAWVARFVSDNCEVILDMFADELLSFEQIAERIAKEIQEYRVSGSMLRFAFMSDMRLSAALTAAQTDRAHTLVEQAVGHANDAARAGDFAQAARIKLVLAEKYAPKTYGAKLAIAGHDGGALIPEGTAGVPDSVLENVVREGVSTRAVH